jgi:hypothetical protein
MMYQNQYPGSTLLTPGHAVVWSFGPTKQINLKPRHEERGQQIHGDQLLARRAGDFSLLHGGAFRVPLAGDHGC